MTGIPVVDTVLTIIGALATLFTAAGTILPGKSGKFAARFGADLRGRNSSKAS